MRFRMLGPIEVVDELDEPVPLGSNERQLLAMLLVHSGETVSTDRLADAMWGDDLPANPQNAIQARISRLRKLVGTETIVTRAPGYAITLEPGALDAARFEQLVIEAGSAADPKLRRDLLIAALELWRGPALADVAYEDFARTEADRLDALRIDAVEARLDADLDLGRHQEVIAELESLVAQHPLREGLYRRLMLALYRSGRQAEALRVFQDARRVLGDELGIEPTPELAALEEAILLHDPSLAADDSLAPSGPAFPTPLTSFVGRDHELARVDRSLTRSRLVTLLGPGGVGKTRLAIEAVGRMEGRRGFVDLGAVTSPELVVAEVVSTYRLDRGQGFGTSADPVALEDAVVAHLTGRNVVLVVDNCEHVVDEAARFLESLLVRVPDLRVVATSRERLGVPGEMVVPVPPMQLTAAGEDGNSEASRLFVERAGSLDPDFDPSGVEHLIDDICARLDGIPLAIELAAARTRSLPVAAIASRLDDRFRLLTGGSRTAVARQRTLRAAIDWSYQLLDPQERMVFRRMALLAGPFGLSPAEHIGGAADLDPADVLIVLERLVDQSMAVPVTAPEPRFRLLENLRAYGRDQLAESGEGAATTRRFVDCYADLVATADPLLRSSAQMEWLERLGAEYDNITAALDLAWSIDEDAAVAMTSHLGWYWYLRGMFEEAHRWLERAKDLPVSGREWTLAEVHFASAMHNLQGPLAGPSLQQSLELARVAGHASVEAMSLAVLGAFAMGDSRARGAQAIAEARQIFERLDNVWGVALTEFVSAAAGGNDVPDAARRAESARQGFAAAGDSWGVGYAEYVLGSCRRALGDYESARELYASALQRANQMGVLHEAANIRTELANVATLRGDFEEAARQLEKATDLAERYPWGAADASAANAAGFLARRTGRAEDGIEHHARAAALYRERKTPTGVAYSVGALGRAELLAGDLERAHSHQRESLSLALETGDGLSVAFALEGLAGVAAVRGDGAGTARLLGAADRLRRDRGVPLPDGEAVEVDQAAEIALATIGRDAFDAAFAEGATLTETEIRELAPTAS